jgi:hypothetical protein
MGLPKILVCGDSFSADWRKRYPDSQGWPTLLESSFEIINRSQAGCSEYRIFLQLTYESFKNFDAVVISHTSPYRLYVKENPIYKNDSLRGDSDFIYSDILDKLKDFPELQSVADYFEHWADLEHAKFVHSLTCEKITSIIKDADIPLINMHHIEWEGLHRFDDVIDFNYLFRSHRGSINHYDDFANREIAMIVEKKLNDLI